MNERKISNIAISGASGFIGSHLASHFAQLGYTISPISRTILMNDDDTDLREILSTSQIVINLAGAPINRFWTNSYKRKLYNSRIISTRKIVQVINQLQDKPQLLISASAIGYYPSEGCYTEYDSKRGSGFLSNLCHDWEYESSLIDSDVRLVVARLGVVLSHNGGAFDQMSFTTRFNVATTVGDSDHVLSWISISDLTAAIDKVIHTSTINGAVNFVAPQSITNRDMLSAMASHYKCVFRIRIPSSLAHILLGEAASFIVDSPCALPQKLLKSDFQYTSPSFNDFLKESI